LVLNNINMCIWGIASLVVVEVNPCILQTYISTKSTYIWATNYFYCY